MTGKIFFCALLAVIATTSAQVTALTSTKVSADNIILADNTGADNFASARDLVFGFTYDLNVAGNLSLAVFKIGNDGQVTKIASQAAIGRKDNRVYNNGEWMGYQSTTDNNLRLFRLDANNQIVNLSTINEPTFVYYLLADNSLVYFDLTFGFQTMLPSGVGQWTLLKDKNIPASLSGAFPYFPAYVNNNTLFFRNESGTVQIYSRTSDGAWKYENAFEDGLGFTIISYNYNGMDTIVAVSSSSPVPGKTRPGYVAFFTRSGNQYIKTVIGVDDMPTIGLVGLGQLSHAFVNNDVFVVSAPYDGFQASKRQVINQAMGSLFFFQRQSDNTWKVSAKSNRTEIGIYGFVSLVTSNHVLTLYTNTTTTTGLGSPTAFFAIPRSTFSSTPVMSSSPTSSNNTPTKKTSGASVQSIASARSTRRRNLVLIMAVAYI